MKPTRPYRALRAGVGTVVIGAVLALWIYGQVKGPALGTLWDVVMLVLFAASCYAVFGRRTMDAAVETAQELKGDNNSEEASDGDA